MGISIMGIAIEALRAACSTGDPEADRGLKMGIAIMGNSILGIAK